MKDERNEEREGHEVTLCLLLV